MPPLSMDDYSKLLQKITVLETKVQRLEVNVEINGLCGNDTTIPLSCNNGKEHANLLLVSTNKTADKRESRVISPPWNALGQSPRLNHFSVI